MILAVIVNTGCVLSILVIKKNKQKNMAPTGDKEGWIIPALLERHRCDNGKVTYLVKA